MSQFYKAPVIRLTKCSIHFSDYHLFNNVMNTGLVY